MKNEASRNKTWAAKLLLDAVMILLLVLMYQKQVISLAFHEIGGLFLFILFGMHIVFNRRWVAAVTRRIFDRSLPVKLHLIYLNDVLLIIAFALTAIGGILISKIVFSFHGAMVWKTVHYTSAAVGLLLAGVHLGLHWSMVSGWLRKHFGLYVSRVVAGICAGALIIAGGINLSTGNFTRWLTMPFEVHATQSGEKNGAVGERTGEGRARGERAGTANGDASTTAAQAATTAQSVDNTQTATGAQAGENTKRGGPAGEGRPQGGAGGHGQRAFSVINLLTVLGRYLSIALGAAALTCVLEALIRRCRIQKIVQQGPEQMLMESKQ